MWIRPTRPVIGVALALAAAIAGGQRATLLAQPTQVHVWITAGDLSRLLAPQPDITFGAPGAPTPFTIAVDDQQQFQQIAGFGASMTESSAWLLSTALSSQAR